MGHYLHRLAPAILLCAAVSNAQEPGTRAAEIESQQAAKAKVVRQYIPQKAEALFNKFQNMLLEAPSGPYPFLGSVYQGGGVTVGPGYRRYYGDNTAWHVHGGITIKNYKLLEAGTESKGHLNRRLSFGATLGWRDATQVPFYGLGMKTEKDDQTSFRFQQTSADGHMTLKPKTWAVIRANLAYEHWETKPGQGSLPSIEERFTPVTAPGLGSDPSFVHSQFSAGIDWRQSPGYTRRGGLYEVALHDYHNMSGGAYNFQRMTGEVIQHVPLLRETWVLAGRARVETILNENDAVPYFMLSTLGNGTTLRGFSTDRFRDRHSLLMNAEFRWMTAVGLDMVFFYDAGKVTRRRSDLDLKGLKSDVGIGARFHGPLSTPLRIDLAVGNEGWRVVMSAGPVF